jgi:uncharacterized membrane protein
MEALFKEIGGYIALGLEAIGTLVIAFGSVQAVVGIIRARVGGPPKPFKEHRQVWVRFAMWLLFGLEFELAADIVRSAISPSWRDIGQLAAIAAIRTVLNYFLEHDIENAGALESVKPVAEPERSPKVRGAAATNA